MVNGAYNLGYTTVLEVQKLAVYKDGTTDAAGKIAQAITSSDLVIKAKLRAVGLTPPATDDTLNAASQWISKGILRRLKREEGSLPIGANASPDTYDATNKAVDSDIAFGEKLVDQYIAQVQTNTQPYDTAGVTRSDAIGKQFKLQQRAIGEFSEE